MNQNFFSLVGKLESVEIISPAQVLRLKLSESGPIKVKAWAEVRDPDLAQLLSQKPNGLKAGDVVSLTGMIVLDEATGMNTLVVSKTGASRIMSAATPPVASHATTPPQAKPPASSTSAPATSRPAPDTSELDSDIPF